ncbi:Bik1p [Saccharomyces cerevisiae x Saccharomyces kudriavzevii VIN7]|uniref:Bik1p n=1 Tax=Saccharomyces cerevisiae x Saccharomyces kudriavzevii (strain VIN7) TaxID=1095631 RepID=H0GRT5_SACCK|nr:Bik1p [Saccharomyces cerevisiae x Saccharomyces kudriavzevii VIN7]
MDRYQRKIGCFIQIPNLGRGQLKYVGPVDAKPGMFAGVDLLANIGKNDGSFMGRKYFDTEYPQSGLFIQLQKVASLIERASISQSSRRTTMEPLSIPKNRSIARLANQFSPMDDPKSPTPMRSFRITSRNSVNQQTMDQEASDHRGHQPQVPAHDDGDDRMEVDSITSSGRKTNHNTGNDWKFNNNRTNDHNSTEVSMELREAQLTIEKLQRKQLHYKRLLDDQRMVLEEVQPTFDRYEATIQEREKEIGDLKQQLELERRQQAKQKQFFDTENEQLLAVVNQLHEEIKENEERNLAHNEPTGGGEDVELLKKQVERLHNIEDQFELHKTKWAKEREQLKMHNDSLSKEYQSLSRELFSSKPNDSSSEEVAVLRKRLGEANERVKQLEQPQAHSAVESLPIFDPPAPVDSTAGRQQWCEHCDAIGHITAECPHRDPDDQQFF